MRKLNESTQIKLGAIVSYLQIALSVLIGIVYSPVMIRILGQGEYGLYSMCSSTISTLGVLNLGFTSGYVRFYSRYKEEKAYESIYRLNGLYFVIFSVIGAIALATGLFLANNLSYVFADGLTENEYKTAKVLMTILTLNMCISFPMGLFQSIINANQKFVFLKLAGIVRTVVSPLVTLPLLLMGFRSVAMVIVQTSLSVVVDTAYVYYAFRVIGTRFRFSRIEKGLLKSIFGFTIFIAIELIVDQINWNIDKVLLGRFCGTESVAIYTVGATLLFYYQMFSTAIAGVFTPRVYRIYNSLCDNERECNQALTELLVKVGRCQFLLLVLVSSGIVTFGRQFIYFWVGAEYDDSYYVTLLLILPASIDLCQNIGIEIQRAKNKHQFRTVAYAIMAILNLFITVILCQKYGPVGAAVGTAISLIVANGVIMNLYYHFRIGLNMKLFWNELAKLSRGLFIPMVFSVIYMNATTTTATGMMIVFIPVYIVVYSVSMWYFGMNRFEKYLFSKPINRIRKRAIRAKCKSVDNDHKRL